MKFKNFLEVNPNLYQTTLVNNETQQLIFQWFQYREICSDKRFLDYFRRQLNMYYDNFILKAELELKEIPEFSNYAEAIRTENSVTGTIKNVGNNSTTSTNSGSNKYTSDDKTTTEQTKDSKHADVSLLGPQSQSYHGSSAGNIPKLDWTFVSSQNQSMDNSGTSVNTSKGTNKHTSSMENKSKATSDNTVTNDIKNITDNMRTGRSETEVEIRQKVWDYLNYSLAFAWFKSKLEPCFIGIYEMEDEY